MASELTVIGAGLPRTGTMSTQHALQLLLGGPCYHMNTLKKADLSFWRGLQTGDVPITSDSFKEFFRERDYVAAVDYPPSHYYKVLMEAYPHAKVLLTVREPEKWYQSVFSTIYQFCCVLPKKWPYSWVAWAVGVKMFGEMAGNINPRMFASISEGKEASVQFYNEWVEEVKVTVPKEKLLVFSVKEGWKPLCEFLGLPIPDTPFPNVNDSATMMKGAQRFKQVTWGVVTVCSAVMVGGVAAGIAYTDV